MTTEPEVIEGEARSVEIAQRPGTGVATSDELGVAQILAQVNLVHEVMAQAMEKDVHYGVIPGVKKPSLFKPGAEKLCMTFRLKPSYRYERIEKGGHVTYIATCTLTHINTGNEWAEGVGSCTTREDRYAYRWTKGTKPNAEREAQMKKEGIGRNRKFGNRWEWQERADNPNVLELDNTILKMAAKRALVAAVLNATAVSDVFTQDVEDMPGGVSGGPAAPAPEPTPEPEKINADQLALLRTAIKACGNEEVWSEETVLNGARRQWGGVEKLEDLTERQVEMILKSIQDWQDKQKEA